MKSRIPTKIESVLLKARLVDEATLSEALIRQRGMNVPLLEVLIGRHQIDEAELVARLAKATGKTPLAEEDVAIQDDVQKLVPRSIIQTHGIIPLKVEDDVLVVAASNPYELDVFDDVAVRCGMRVRVELAAPSHIRHAIKGAQLKEDPVDKLLRSLPESDVDLIIAERNATDPSPKQPHAAQALDFEARDAPITRLINFLLLTGIQQRASDIHIEPERGHTRVRFRVDGDLREVLVIPQDMHPRAIARIKIMAGMDIIETRRPQDGGAKVHINNVPYDLRVNTIPSYFGEKAVIRVLDSGNQLELRSLGLDSESHDAWLSLLHQPNGLLLLTGPTGSGKTTTLYASVLELRHPTRNVITVEDPVEYQLPGVVHVPVNKAIGLTFATALRAILRQDPDVILLGEIRDQESAEIAFKAAQTGHLVLSTLHTNTALAAIPRLTDLGVSRFVISSVLLGIMAQRLIRTLCVHCSAPFTYDPGDMALICDEPEALDQSNTKKGVGCQSCHGTGFSGRQGIVELLTLTPDFRQLLAEEASDKVLLEQVRRDGGRSLVDAGLDIVLQGRSAPSEVARFATVDLKPKKISPNHGKSITHSLTKASDHSKAYATTPCSQCGRLVAEDWRHCPHCGGNVKTKGPDEMKLLICDDDPITRRIVATVLRDIFHQVQFAAHGKEALDSISKDMPDFLILDHNMPELKGLEVVRALRSEIRTMLLPIIFMTNDLATDLELDALRAGANDFVRKPIEAKKLRALVKAVLTAHTSDLIIT